MNSDEPGKRQAKSMVLVSAPLDRNLHESIAAGRHPRQDLFTLAEVLKADVIAPLPQRSRQPGHFARFIEVLRVAWTGFRNRKRYDLIVSDLDRVGLTLAAMLKIARSDVRHVVICHGKISRGVDLRLLKWLRLTSKIHGYICYGAAVADRLKKALGSQADRVTMVRHPADHRFWRPLSVQPERLVVAAGMARRDYPTLVLALEGQDVKAELAAHSPWVLTGGDSTDRVTPPNVSWVQHDYPGLRELYSRAMFVAIPLSATYSQAGSLVAYEAMAMGKPVVITRTEGIAALGLIEDGVTGFYVDPGDVDGWREVIRRFLADPSLSARMGSAARRVVEEGLNMDTWAREVAAAVEGTDGGSPV